MSSKFTDDISSDPRFSDVLTDPRFRTFRKSEKKVKIDKRFKNLFTESKFQQKCEIDKRGKPNTSNNAEDFKRFYDISDDSNDGENESDNEFREINGRIAGKPHIPDARGNDNDSDQTDDSSSDSDDSDAQEDDIEIDHKWGEWDKDVPQINESTKRLAICNLDWDRINATDLYILLNSFKPNGGSIHYVKIYPSLFGRQRIQIEEQSGPIPLIDDQTDKINYRQNEAEDKDEETMNIKTREQLRKYQMARLKYFYAVVECDSEATAQALYAEIDGMEYESSSSSLDLRFIPNEMTFDDMTPKTECSSMPDITGYKPPQFINSALQQSNVKLTWDETDPNRRSIFENAFNNKKEIDDDDLKAYLASDDDDDDQEETTDFDDNANIDLVNDDEKINKYKELLTSLNDPKSKSENNLEMEITWEPDLKDITENIVQQNTRKKDVTTFEENYIKIKQKRKNQKNIDRKRGSDGEQNDEQSIINKKECLENTDNAAKANLELLLMDVSENSNKKHFNYKNIVEDNKNRNKKVEDNFKFDAEDERFSALYTSHHYNVDPSDPHYKKTEAFVQIINRTKKVKYNTKNIEKTDTSQAQNKNSWSHIVKSVKRKTQQRNKKTVNSFIITDK